MILISLIFCISGVLLLWKISPPSVNKINNITINVYFYYMVLSLIGSFIISSSTVSYDLVSNYIKSDSKEYSLFVISLNFFVYCFSILLLLLFLGESSGRIFDNFKKQNLKASINESKIYKIMTYAYTLCIIGLIYLLFFDKTVPLALLISGVDFKEIYNARIDSFNTGIILFVIKKLLYETSIICALYFFLHKSIFKKVSAILVCILYGFLQTEKAPIIYFILALVFISSFKTKMKISFLKSVLIVLLCLLFLSCMYFVLYNQNNIYESISNVINRVFIQQVSGVFLSIQYFGADKPFDLGYNLFPRLYLIFDFESSKIIAEQLAEKYLYSLYSTGAVKNINGLYIMDAWAAGGLIGTLLITITLAVYCVFTYVFFLRKRKEPIVLVFYTYFSVYNLSFITSAGVSIFSPFALLFLIAFTFLYKNSKNNMV